MPVPKDLDFEEELDSQKGNSSEDDDDIEVQEEKEEIEELKIQDCLISFFQHIEDEEPSEYPNDSWKPARP